MAEIRFPVAISIFHDISDMKEPEFEFIHPPQYYPEQKAFPHKQPFNM